MNKIFGIAVIIFTIVSCKEEAKTFVDISNISVNVKIDRFEQQFYTANESNLEKLKSEYPYLFPTQNPDSIWLQKINNREEQLLFKKSQEVFKNFDDEKLQIEELFQHISYYHPTFKSPKIITLITNLDYENKIMYADSLLFVSLDMYLGKNDEVYKDFPEYLSKNYDKSQLTVDIANAISEKFLVKSRNRQFIDDLINEGKKLYLLDSYLPSATDAQKIGYSNDEIEWISLNETQIWTYFIENNLLYSTDAQLNKRFIENAPFSKFYINIDKESPGRVGVWLGWQIVRSYMKNNNVTLQQLLLTNADEIFKKSKYKPKK
ncbi:gliding motility lipoprotein GldB [Lutibacter sp.]|uniref:gliding motility lipoprotein GldB n=1 Tax=Lutibacter sp. TaxID=1925666 RepID=UPI001A1897BC|nr:gliding motility lipoprotein GldB [Lutibacter sp.]MBI9042332.1 gliding motility lipoprotein GldB [Lutibacter sp.]